MSACEDPSSTVQAFDKTIPSFLSYNFMNYVAPPQPSLNGGLYTGEAFHRDAPYRNFPNQPDIVHLRSETLLSANPPPGATSQYTASELLRPGNHVAHNIPKSLYTHQLPRCNGPHSSSHTIHTITCTKPTPTIEEHKAVAYNRLYFH